MLQTRQSFTAVASLRVLESETSPFTQTQQVQQLTNEPRRVHYESRSPKRELYLLMQAEVLHKLVFLPWL